MKVKLWRSLAIITSNTTICYPFPEVVADFTKGARNIGLAGSRRVEVNLLFHSIDDFRMIDVLTILFLSGRFSTRLFKCMKWMEDKSDVILTCVIFGSALHYYNYSHSYLHTIFNWKYPLISAAEWILDVGPFHIISITCLCTTINGSQNTFSFMWTPEQPIIYIYNYLTIKNNNIL